MPDSSPEDPNDPRLTLPERLHDELTGRYPRLVDTYERAIRHKGTEGHADWSGWCFAAGSVAASIASRRHAEAPGEVRAGQAFEDIHRIAALAAWRPHRRVLDISRHDLSSIEEVSPPRRLRPDTFDFGVWCPFVFLGEGPGGQGRGLFLYLDGTGKGSGKEGPPMLVGVVAREDLACRTLTVALGQGSLTSGIEAAMREISSTREVESEGAVEVEEEALKKETVPRLGRVTDYAKEARLAAKVALVVARADWSPPLPDRPRRTIAAAEETTVCSPV